MWKFKQIGLGDKVTPELYNEIIVRLNQMTRIFGNVSGQLTTQGFHLTANFRDSGIGKISLFEIQSNATGNGVYDCRLQKIDGSAWNSGIATQYIIEASTVSIEVYNLQENEEVSAWVTATDYVVSAVRSHSGTNYRCILLHTSGATNEPGVGGSWTTYWSTDVVYHRLGAGVKLYAWQSLDDTGVVRWVGIPILSRSLFLDILKDMFDECE